MRLLKVRVKRTTFTTGGADPTVTVKHRIEARHSSRAGALAELVVQEFQDVYTVRVYWKGKEKLFASGGLAWLGEKWHQWLEERLALEQLEEDHHVYWH